MHHMSRRGAQENGGVSTWHDTVSCPARASREADKAAIMTMVARGGADEAHRLQHGLADLAVALDERTRRLLAYATFRDGPDGAPAVRLALR